LHRFRHGLVHGLPFGSEAVNVLSELLLNVERKLVIRDLANATIVGDPDAVIFLPQNSHIVVGVTVFCRPILRRKR
jgi:ethanolamine utilization protein EutQ (cupin superfamily)